MPKPGWLKQQAFVISVPKPNLTSSGSVGRAIPRRKVSCRWLPALTGSCTQPDFISSSISTWCFPLCVPQGLRPPSAFSHKDTACTHPISKIISIWKSYICQDPISKVHGHRYQVRTWTCHCGGTCQYGIWG